MPLDDLLQDAPSTEQYIARFLQQHPGSPDAEDAFRSALTTRQESDRGKRGSQRDLNLRDAEHALFSQMMVDQHPVLGRLQTAVTVPGYAAAKVLSQNYPGTNPLVKAITGMDFSGSTKPDLRELYWGLRPVFKSVRSE